MRRVSIAASSQLSANAGAVVADQGGNAVDAAVAACFAAMCTDPGIIGPGASGFLTIHPAQGDPVVIDAYAEMPGRGLEPDKFGHGGREIFMEYGGGMKTIIGHGSVATPGAIAGLGAAMDRYGELPWAVVLEPAIDWAARGFPLGRTSSDYMAYSAELIFGWLPESRAALHHPDGKRLHAGDLVRIEGLADALRLLARDGAACFYTGELGRAMIADMEANDGIITLADLEAYRPVVRAPTSLELDGWTVVTNPPPAVGGASLAALLLLLAGVPRDAPESDHVARHVAAQHAVFSYRAQQFDAADDRTEAARSLLDAARMSDFGKLLDSPSTIHVSAADSDGTACSMTVSAGYGSGVMIPGTGMWLNNSLGELELLPGGYHGFKPGTRLPSNMAPTIAYREGEVLAIGSPGASRITSALAQSLHNFIHRGMALSEAIDHPRLHVEEFDGSAVIAHEPGLPMVAHGDLGIRGFPDRSMYFGGVQAALWDRAAGLFEVADPRRTGGVARGGG